MKTTRTDRIIIEARTSDERVAITLEYLASFISWSERLNDEELGILDKKTQRLIHPTNMQSLNNFLEDCVKYLHAEQTGTPGADFDGSGVYLTLPSA